MRPRILAVGDATVGTGFSRVLESILKRLKDRFEIHHLGLGYSGDPHTLNWPVYIAARGGDLYGITRLQELIEKIQPDLLFFVNDLWVLLRYVAILRSLKKHLPAVAYVPLDGGPIDPELIRPLGDIERLVVYNQFGFHVIQDAVCALQKEVPSFSPPVMAMIPHGIDTHLFRPLRVTSQPVGESSERRFARQKLFPDRPDLFEAFIVLNANRNQPRKRIDLTLQGFALFAEGKPPNVKLYLHMGLEDMGWNIIALAKRYGIAERVLVSGLGSTVPSDSIERLNLIYNACDVGLNTSTGEGWGLVSFEHAATGAAQIVPRHSACAELWEGAGVLIDPVFSLTMEGVLTVGYFVSPQGVAQALERLYTDEIYRQQMSVAARMNASQSRYDWDVIAQTWEELFNTVLQEHRERSSLTGFHRPKV